jgi:hypothetical protein
MAHGPMKLIKKNLFALILIMMLAPALVKAFPDLFTFNIPPLKGYRKTAAMPELNLQNWFSGSYQQKYEHYLEDHIGLKNLLLRLHNQLDFSLFRKGNVAYIVVGRDNCLYETNYILAYTGQDFLGLEAIENKCRMIKTLQDSLEASGTELLIVMPPGKASFFPENIPDRFLEKKTDSTNYETYTGVFRRMGINHIDFNALFTSMKDTSRFALYHKCGIHWSIYGAWFALDSIIRHIEARRNIDMVDMHVAGFELSDIPRGTDYDMGDALNLFCRIHDRPMAYPYGYKYETEGKVKPGIMVVADSYYWTIYNLHNSWLLWKEQDFRYYNQESFSPGKPAKKPERITGPYLKRFDLIMIMYTEANLPKFANGFFAEALAALPEARRFEEIRQGIIRSPERLKQTRRKAIERGISLQEMIDREARWVLIHETDKVNHHTEIE